MSVTVAGCAWTRYIARETVLERQIIFPSRIPPGTKGSLREKDKKLNGNLEAIKIEKVRRGKWWFCGAKSHKSSSE